MKNKRFLILVLVVFIAFIGFEHIQHTYSLELYMKSQDNKQLEYIYQHHQQYPEELINLAIKNEETIDFVKNYINYKENPTIPTNIGELSHEVPLLLQWDQRWGYLAYGNNCIALTGCGPTCLSMVISYLTQDNTITPYTIASYSLKHHYYLQGVGTKWELMTKAASHFGVNARQLSLSKENMIQELNLHHPLIASVRKGDFTDKGHFIVISQYKNGQFKVNDPNSISKSNQLYDYERLEEQINNIWVYSL